MMPNNKLIALYKQALQQQPHELCISGELLPYLDTIIKLSNDRKAVLAMTITLLLKKSIDIEQDITLHQQKMEKGFSARGFDSSYVTPFLKNNDFPYMISGSGALTRSLEQSLPYDLDYPGAISPSKLKKAFLQVINAIQVDGECPNAVLLYLLTKLIVIRDLDKNIKLTKPTNLSIKDMIAKIKEHFEVCKKGSRLPVLVIYAVYKVLIKEVSRYKNCTLCELQPHQSADAKSKFLGDVQINTAEDNMPFEIIEIKHNIKLTPALVNDCYKKFKKTQVNTYYLLSTNEDIDNPEEVSNKIMEIYGNHGCQVIVNGIFSTLKYYLRLLKNQNTFWNIYIELLEEECNYDIKIKWQELWEHEKKQRI